MTTNHSLSHFVRVEIVKLLPGNGTGYVNGNGVEIKTHSQELTV